MEADGSVGGDTRFWEERFTYKWTRDYPSEIHNSQE